MASSNFAKTAHDLLNPPTFADEKKNQQAFILHILLISLLTLEIIYLGFSLLLSPQTSVQDIEISVVGIVVNAFLLVLLRRGYVRPASIIQVATFWLLFTLIALTEDGIYSPAYMMGYILVILIAGILLGGAGALVMTGLSLAAGVVIYHFQLIAALPAKFNAPLIDYWVISAFMFPLCAVLQYLASHRMQQTLARAVESEAAYRILFDESPFPIAVTRMDGRCVDANQSFCQMVGIPCAEIIGKNAVELGLIEKAQNEQIELAFEQLGRKLDQFDVMFQLPDGKALRAMVSSKVVIFHGENHVITICNDITKRVQAELELKESEERYRNIADAAFEGIMINRNGIILDANQKFAEIFGYRDPSEIIGKNGLDFLLTPESSAKVQARLMDKPGMVYDVSGMKKDGTRFQGETQSREMIYRGEKAFVVTMRDITDRIAAAAELRRVNQALQATNQELERSYDAALEGWSDALELRERDTAGHSQRVVDLTLAIARSMGLQESQLIHIRRGALLHDIGKMGIPDSILLKPGPLTEDERATMRHHPIFAYKLLKRIEYLQPALDIPYYHHERWDGLGYPNRIAGDRIPIAARIFTVVDVWDALTSDRPYRPAWTKEEAFQYIQNQSGKQFDPQVVQEFIRITEASLGR